MKKNKFAFLNVLLVLSALIPLSSSAKKMDPSVYFKNLKNGQTIPADYVVQFGVKAMKVKPAGEVKDGTGHHHLIIDGGSIAQGQVIPADEKHIHFGKGQTETKLNLTPGEHTLTLQFANGAHLSYGPSLSATVKVNVQ